MTAKRGLNAKKAVFNLDWTRDPPPSIVTPYQQYIRDVDWSRTQLGPMQSWRRELRQVVLFMMAEVNPVILYWGDLHTIIYNEAYIPLVGKKHPQLQGMNALDAFPDFWAYFDQIITEQQFTGETRVGEASMLLMERHGFLEETYFNWKLIPVVGDDGTMLGSYGRPSESSGEVISSRRAECVQKLTQRINGTTSLGELWRQTIEGLDSFEKDIPMAMLYSVKEQNPDVESPQRAPIACRLEGLLGIPQDHACVQDYVNIQQESNGLAPSMLAAFNKGSVHVITLADAGLEHFFKDIESRGFELPSEELVFLPVKANGVVTAILVLGLNPYLKFTHKYSNFVQMLGDALSAQMSRLRLAGKVNSQEQLAKNALLDFRESEMRFFRFADRLPLGLTLTDRDGKVVYANKAWYQFCGLTADAIEPTNWIETVHEEDQPLINDWLHKVISLKQSGTFQIRSRAPFISGHMTLPHRAGIVAIYPDLDGNGNVSSAMGLVTDISELKWTEEQLLLRQRELEELEKIHRISAANAPIGVVRTDKRGYVQFANDTWRSFYNFERDHVFTEPQPWLTSLNKEDAPSARKYFEDLSSTGISQTIEVRLKRPKTRLEAERTSSMEFWILATGFGEFTSDGVLHGITFWVTDISNQKAAEKILTDKMEEAIRLKTTQERFVDMISHEIRNPLSAILHCGEEIVDAMKGCLSLAETPPAVEGETIGEIHTHAPIRGYIHSAFDAANTIMYCVQHQKQIVDDVLTLSKLDADLLVVSPIPVEPTELVRSALKIFEPELKASSIELAFEIDVSLQELGVDWVMLDPNRFLQIVINLVTNAIKFTRNSAIRRIIISVSARHDEPPQTYQGVHYVPRREIGRGDAIGKLENGIDQTLTDKALYLCFSVTDTGKGLTESERTILFNRFAQASPKTHIEYGGSGLGLFISRQITEMLGGEIGVGSEPGKGATFAFYVRTRHAKPPRRASLGLDTVSMYTKTLMTPTPGTWVAPEQLNKSMASKRERQRPVLSTPEPTSRKRRVLVVEDNLVNQKVLCKQLRNRGFTVDAANHGREALDTLEKVLEHEGDDKAHFDVILCDIEMPVMDGIECVTEIRRLEKDGKFRGHVPIIGVTANVRSKQVNTAIEVGMDGVTTKPYRIDELIAHIDRVSANIKTSKQV